MASEGVAMTPGVRKLSLVLIASLVLLAAGCSSNNKGKIVGRWKATSFPGLSSQDAATLNQLGEGNVYVILEFTADGKMVGTATIKAFGQTINKEVMHADYSLGYGDWVHTSNMSPPLKNGMTKGKDKVVITGDTMTIDMESGDKLTLTRFQ
jgi:hypothetical protein